MERPNEKQISFFIDTKEREQFQQLCKTKGVSGSTVLRLYVQKCLEEQDINIESPLDNRVRVRTNDLTPDPQLRDQQTVMMKRIDKVERVLNYINEQELEFIKNEVLNDEFGSIRNRVGVLETKIQELGGSITWKED